MIYTQIHDLKKTYFGYEDIARVLGISLSSAKVSAVRYVKTGLLVRLKRNVYLLSERWRNLGWEERFAVANIGQAPSYISLMTALSYYEVATQLQQDFIESMALKRTRDIRVGKAIFNYIRINKALYFGFTRDKGYFIASPEKAFLDAIYLMTLGRYHLDTASVDFKKLDLKVIQTMLKKFPDKVAQWIQKNGYFSQA